MAAFQSWYSNRRPYVHDLPEGENDNFQPFFIKKIEEGKINADYRDAISRLRSMVDKTRTFENTFFSSMGWGVRDAEDFSNRFLAMADFRKNEPESLNPENSSLFQQVRRVINNPELHRIINSRDENYFKTLGREAAPFFTKRVVPIVTQIYEKDARDYMVNSTEAILKAFSATTLTLGPRSNIMRSTTAATKQANAAQRDIATRFRQGEIGEKSALSDLNKLFRETIPVLVRPIDASVLEQSMAYIAKGLNAIPTVYFDSVGFGSKNVAERKSIIIKDILQEAKIFLTKMLSTKSGSLLEANVTGDLGEFSIEISSKAQETKKITTGLSFAIFNMPDIRMRGSERSTGSYWANSVQTPVDAQITHFLFQLKSHRPAILGQDKAFNKITLRDKDQSFTELLNQIQDSGVMSGENLDQLMYDYANYAARGRADEVGAVASLLINWAVEFFVRSDTTEALLDYIEGFPVPKQPLGHQGANLDKMPLNHFWIVGNKLFGISNVLQAALNALMQYESIESWHKGVIRLTPPKTDMGVFTSEKMELRSQNPDWSSGEQYGRQVLEHGKAKGDEIISGTTMSEIQINLTTLNHILAAFQP